MCWFDTKKTHEQHDMNKCIEYKRMYRKRNTHSHTDKSDAVEPVSIYTDDGGDVDETTAS